MSDPSDTKPAAGLARFGWAVGRGWGWYKNLISVGAGIWASAWAIDAAWSEDLGELASPPARIWIMLPIAAVGLVVVLPLAHFLVNSLFRVATIAAAPGLVVAAVILGFRGAPEFGVIVGATALYAAAIALLFIPFIEESANQADVVASESHRRD